MCRETVWIGARSMKPCKLSAWSGKIVTIVGGFSTALALARASDLVASVPERHTGVLRAGMHSFPSPGPGPAVHRFLALAPAARCRSGTPLVARLGSGRLCGGPSRHGVKRTDIVQTLRLPPRQAGCYLWTERREIAWPAILSKRRSRESGRSGDHSAPRWSLGVVGTWRTSLKAPATEEWLAALHQDAPASTGAVSGPGHGFVLLAHTEYAGLYRPPHDHGRGWVIYAMQQGEIEMGPMRGSRSRTAASDW